MSSLTRSKPRPIEFVWNEQDGTMHEKVEGLYGPALCRVKFEVVGRFDGLLVLEANLPHKARLFYFNDLFDASPLRPTQYLRQALDKSFDRLGGWDHLPDLASVEPGFHPDASQPGQAWGGHGNADFLFGRKFSNQWIPVLETAPDASAWLTMEEKEERWGALMRETRLHFRRRLSDTSVNRLVNAVGTPESQMVFARLLEAAVGRHGPTTLLDYPRTKKGCSMEDRARLLGTKGWPLPMTLKKKTKAVGWELMVLSSHQSSSGRMVLLSDEEIVDRQRPGRAGKAVWDAVANQCSTWHLPPAPSNPEELLGRLVGTCAAADLKFLA